MSCTETSSASKVIVIVPCEHSLRRNAKSPKKLKNKIKAGKPEGSINVMPSANHIHTKLYNPLRNGHLGYGDRESTG